MSTSITGLPLEDILKILDKNNMMINWLEYIKDSLQCNWKFERTIERIRNVLIDLYGSDYANLIIEKIKNTGISEWLQESV